MSSVLSPTPKSHYDQWGVFLSFLCGIHCLVTPLILIMVPTMSHFFEPLWAHSLLILLVTFVFYKSVFSNYKSHRSKATLLTGLVGLTLLFAVFFAEVFMHAEEHGHAAGEHHQDGPLIIAISIVGSLFLIASHMLNLRHCRNSVENKSSNASESR